MANWEIKFWSYVSQGDGVNCPVYNSCPHIRSGGMCISGNPDYFEIFSQFKDSEDASEFSEFPHSPPQGILCKLAVKFADKYRKRIKVGQTITADNLVEKNYSNLPLEVRQVPLKTRSGAIWRLDNSWVIYLNCNDTLARQRFTLYHEIFHLIAHTKGVPIFKKPYNEQGFFNEFLADEFATMVLLPKEQVEEKWSMYRDVGRLADIFLVPKTIMYSSLRRMRLI